MAIAKSRSLIALVVGNQKIPNIGAGHDGSGFTSKSEAADQQLKQRAFRWNRSRRSCHPRMKRESSLIRDLLNARARGHDRKLRRPNATMLQLAPQEPRICLPKPEKCVVLNLVLVLLILVSAESTRALAPARRAGWRPRGCLTCLVHNPKAQALDGEEFSYFFARNLWKSLDSQK
jgi:hypothetical protein